MKYLYLILMITILSSCYKTLELEGFDKSEWKAFKTACSDYRLEKIDHLIANKDLILNASQNEVESLLGQAEEHELYDRNQKFFHYRITPYDTCKQSSPARQFLSIRFNAIGRASEVLVMVR